MDEVYIEELNQRAVPSTADIASEPERELELLRASIDPLWRRLLEHSIYEATSNLPRLRVFMATHVFAVWDFMCLAKRLQRDLTSLAPLWVPPAQPNLARFINSVILGEESDEGPEHDAVSHCELYMAAMDEVNAPTAPIREFLRLITAGEAVETALATSGIPPAAKDFVRNTLHYVQNGSTAEVLSAFLFGREDLIPDMFRRILPRWPESRKATRFNFYVARHIALDAEHHGPAGRRALMLFAGRDARVWSAARRVAADVLSERIKLWDSVTNEFDRNPALSL